MKPFVINRHGRLVFPSNFLPELDFSVLADLDALDAVIARDFEAKTPTGTDLLERRERGARGRARAAPPPRRGGGGGGGPVRGPARPPARRRAEPRVGQPLRD